MKEDIKHRKDDRKKITQEELMKRKQEDFSTAMERKNDSMLTWGSSIFDWDPSHAPSYVGIHRPEHASVQAARVRCGVNSYEEAVFLVYSSKVPLRIAANSFNFS